MEELKLALKKDLFKKSHKTKKLRSPDGNKMKKMIRVPSSHPIMISPLFEDQEIHLILLFPCRLAVNLANFSFPGFSISKTAISPSSKPPVKT